jgi:predicted transcriptional regulator
VNGPLDLIEFLAASENRVRVLEHLYETPADRKELHDRTGISRPTLSRTLRAMEHRGWITQNGSACEITPLGAYFFDAFTDLLEAAETADKLRTIERWLPTDEMDFDLDHFHDATITPLNPADPTVLFQMMAQMTRDADHIRFLSTYFVPQVAEVLREETVNGEQTVEAVITDRVVQTIQATPEMTRLVSETIEAGASFYRFDGSLPTSMTVIDKTTAGIVVVDDEGVQRAIVKSNDDAIRTWVDSTIDDYRQEADPLTADRFTH